MSHPIFENLKESDIQMLNERLDSLVEHTPVGEYTPLEMVEMLTEENVMDSIISLKVTLSVAILKLAKKI
jgi:hypothetical protein